MDTWKYPEQGTAAKVWQSLLAVIAFVILVGGYLYYRSEEARLNEEQYRFIAGIGEQKSGQVQQWRFERLADARVAASDPILIRAVAEYLRDTARIGPKRILRASLSARSTAYLYPEVSLLFPDGSFLSSADSAGQPADTSAGKAVSRVRAGGDAMLSEFAADSGGSVHIDVVAAMRDSAGKGLGVVVLRCDPQVFFRPLIRYWPASGSASKGWIVERQGDQVAYLGGGSENRETSLAWRKVSAAEAPSPIKASLRGHGAFAGMDWDGRRVLADLRPIPNSGWLIVTQADPDEILAEGRFRIRAIAAMVAGVLLLSFGSFILINRQRQASMFKERYLSERRRREDQEARRILLDSIGDAVITTDTAGRVREMNPAAASLTGWSEAEAKGVPLEAVFRVSEAPRDPVAPHSGLPGVPLLGSHGGKLEPHDILLRRDGSERPIYLNASPIRGMQGESTGSVVVISDQTRQHAAHQALIQSEAKFRDVLQTINLIAIILDEKGRLTLCSDFLLELTGWMRADVIGKDWFSRFLPTEDREPVFKVFEGFFKGDFPSRFENQIVTRQGRRRTIGWRNSTLRDEAGRTIGVVAFGEDITERKEAEDRIRQSEQRLQLLIEHCPGAIAMFDREMRYLVVSPRWIEDYHLEGKDVVGKSHYEVFPDIPQRWKDIHRRCVAGAIEKCEEDPFPRASGGVEWVRWEIHPWKDDHEEIGGIVMFTEVITPRKQAQEDLKKLNAELELRVQRRTSQLADKNKELETFSYSVSHDLKAPLRGIDGYSKILLDEYSGKIDEEGQGFLKNIRSGTEQMQQLIEDMLDYSKLERRSLSVAPIEMRNAVDRIMQERAFDLLDAKVAVEVAEGFVSADPEGLAMVLRNLIDNAVKFSRGRKPPTVDIRSRAEGGRHILSIRDNGTGFSMKHHDLIFQIFQRLHRAEEFSGTGVGLAIVKKAMDRMEGRVWAESEPGMGAVFHIDLPCAEKAA
jgi:PAS domain S-box-containing protein